MDIYNQRIDYPEGIPYRAQLCRITHLRPHYHDKDLELDFCLEGNVDLVAGHQQVTINAGEIFSVDCRDIHYLHSQQDNLILVFHLNLAGLSVPWEELEYMCFACESSHCYPYQKEHMNEIKDILFALSFLFVRGDYASFHCSRQCKDISDKLMDILLKYFNFYNYEDQDEHRNPELYDRFYRVTAYCFKNYKHKISISQLARLTHIQKNYFSQFMSKTIFSSFREMINYIRCYEAEQLLLRTELSVTEISYSCGFSDPKYFYSAFKFWWGCTPAKHRRRYAEIDALEESIDLLAEEQSLSSLASHMIDWHIKKILPGGG